jgi:hypothetical protein
LRRRRLASIASIIWAGLCRVFDPSWRSQIILQRPATLVAIITVSRALRVASQVPMIAPVRPCVSGRGGIG